MPIRKFHSVEEMERPIWHTPGEASLYRAIARVWGFGRRSGHRRFPPGVYRHRSVLELNAQSERWSVANFERHRAKVRRGE
jgi:hypothetical protein